MNPSTLTATGAADSLARKWGIEADLTPLARQEQAFNDMVANARKFDGSFEAARDRFQAAIRGEMK
jgi:hypothetical protein